MSPNAQAGCERTNSDINTVKDKGSVRMSLPVVLARIRIKENGPPVSLFKPAEIRQLWVQKGHQYAGTESRKKKNNPPGPYQPKFILIFYLVCR